jgi:putative heme transporter
VRLVAVPLVIALFPAALLAPVAEWLKRRKMPAALASLLTIAASLGVLYGVGRLVVPVVVAQVPQIAESMREALDQLQIWLQGTPLGGQLDVFDQPLEEIGERFGGAAGDVAGATLSALVTVAETLVAVLLGLVALFFYLKDGKQIARALVGLFPPRLRTDVEVVSERIWTTLGAYFRGQLLVALVDAIGIGIGLLVLGVPLAFPLAVLVLVGGLFPIVGAFLSGTVAVLVALADQGLVTALLVLAVVIAVQQLESNVMEPIVLSRAIHLHPLMVLVSIATGAILLGVLGAFLAVPVAASIARTVEYLRGEDRDTQPASAA